MKTTCFVAALCLVLSCTVVVQSARLDRSLKQTSVSVRSSASCTARNGNCRAASRVTSQAIDDAASSIASALSTAVAQAEGDGDVDASATAFAQAIARAYARITSSHVLSVYASPGSTACAFTSVSAEATASAIAQATSRAFARSTNAAAQAAADCFSSAVASASVRAVQRANFGTCTNYGSNLIYVTLETVGYVEAVATAFSNVFTAIRNNDPVAAANCAAIGNTNSGVITTLTRSG